MPKGPEAFRTISEVAAWLGEQTHVLRFWESKFSQVKPFKGAGGRRYYRPGDMALLGGIKVLLKDRGMTIRGVQLILAEEGVHAVAAHAPRFEGSLTEDLEMAAGPRGDANGIRRPDRAGAGVRRAAAGGGASGAAEPEAGVLVQERGEASGGAGRVEPPPPEPGPAAPADGVATGGGAPPPDGEAAGPRPGGEDGGGPEADDGSVATPPPDPMTAQTNGAAVPEKAEHGGASGEDTLGPEDVTAEDGRDARGDPPSDTEEAPGDGAAPAAGGDLDPGPGGARPPPAEPDPHVAPTPAEAVAAVPPCREEDGDLPVRPRPDARAVGANHDAVLALVRRLEAVRDRMDS